MYVYIYHCFVLFYIILGLTNYYKSSYNGTTYSRTAFKTYCLFYRLVAIFVFDDTFSLSFIFRACIAWDWICCNRICHLHYFSFVHWYKICLVFSWKHIKTVFFFNNKNEIVSQCCKLVLHYTFKYINVKKVHTQSFCFLSTFSSLWQAEHTQTKQYGDQSVITGQIKHLSPSGVQVYM